MMQQEQQWKTEQYHGTKIWVKAHLREQENPALDGHGLAWDYLVSVGEAEHEGDAPDQAPDPQTAVRSDRNVFYSTQVIAEQMGFIKGRELVDHRHPATPNPNAAAQATDGSYSANAERGEHGRSTL